MTLAILSLPRPILAAPRITVRGRPLLRLSGTSHDSGKTIFEGDLRDAARSRPLGRRSIHLDLETGARRYHRHAITDAMGHFRFVVKSNPGPHHVTISFAGDRLFLPSTLPSTLIDVLKPVVTLGVLLPKRIASSAKDFPLRITTLSKRHRVSLPITVSLDSPRGHTILARLVTHAESPRLVTLETRLLGRPGLKTLYVRFSGNSRFNGAQTIARTILSTLIHVTLKADRGRVDAEGHLRLRGRVRDLAGPLANATVSIEAMGRHVISATTSQDGHFASTLAASPFPPGILDLQAVVTPSLPWHILGRSPSLSVTIEAPRRLPLSAYLTTACVTFFISLVAFAWHRRDVLQRWIRRLRRQRSSLPVATTRPDNKAAPLPQAGGLLRGRGRHVLRQNFNIAGIIWDPIDTLPLVDAHVSIEAADGQERETSTNTTGFFAFEDLPHGMVTLRVRARGYVSEESRLQIPHRGGLDHLRVHMIPVRVRLLEIYRSVAQDLLPKPNLWARWTPRDLLIHRRKSQATSPALASLSALLEESYWSPTPADEGALTRADTWARRLTNDTEDETSR